MRDVASNSLLLLRSLNAVVEKYRLLCFVLMSLNLPPLTDRSSDSTLASMLKSNTIPDVLVFTRRIRGIVLESADASILICVDGLLIFSEDARREPRRRAAFAPPPPPTLSTGSALFRLDLKESGYKVAWIENPLQHVNYFLQPDFAPRAPSSRPCFSCNKQPAGVLELAKLERRGPQSR
jgi:hypothetical protein